MTTTTSKGHLIYLIEAVRSPKPNDLFQRNRHGRMHHDSPKEGLRLVHHKALKHGVAHRADGAVQVWSTKKQTNVHGDKFEKNINERRKMEKKR
jgi:hypothetical protein